jgi:membrane associated rhomboid family serine protease
MHKLYYKFKLVFIPFLVVAIAFIGGYTLLHLLLIKLMAFSLPEDMVNYWIPIALPWIPILVWLRPRIRLLKLKTDTGDLPFLYRMAAWFALCIPTIIAQHYIETASGKLTQLASVERITVTDTKYYSLQNCYIDKANAVEHTTFEVSGRHNENFNMHIYFALPILNSAADTAGENCVAWYGVEYDKQLSNSLSNQEKEEKYRQFARESQGDFDKTDVGRFIYLERIGNTADHNAYNAAISNSNKYVNNSMIVLLPINEPFEARNGGTLGWIFKTLGVGSLLWLIMVLIPKLDEDAVERRKGGRPDATEKESGKEVLDFFIPREGYFITPIIINLNILMFIIMVCAGLGFVSFGASDLLNWGGNYRPSTTNGEWWRLLTSTFLHGGLMHLMANMCGLLFVGVFLEPILGRLRYAVVYLLTGIIASASSLWWHDATVSVGASGAIFGLYGLFVALLLLKVFPKDFGKAFLVSTLIFVGYNLLMGFAGGIDNAAHIGGLVSGFVVGLVLHRKLKREVGRRMEADDHDAELVENENEAGYL